MTEMIDGSMVHNQVRDDSDAAIACRLRELDEISQRPVPRVAAIVVANVVPVLPARRRKERLKPQATNIQPREIIQLPRQAEEVADPVSVPIRERLHIECVHDGVLVPKAFHTTPLLNKVAGLALPCGSHSAL
jgi:hypothetical protein